MATDQEVGNIVNEITISYTVRELLLRIEERLVRMETRTEAVATKADLEAARVKMESRTEALSEKVDKLESVRDRMMGAAFAVGALAGAGGGWIANLLTAN